MRSGLTGICIAAIAGMSAPALANGRFPSSVSVSVRPGNATDIYLGTTFGLLISHDDGARFHWVCEDAIGYTGTFDPKLTIGRDGTLYATTFDGLRVSRDGGCTFELATADQPESDPGRFAGKWVDALDLGPDGELWVATAEGGLANDVYRSTDGGHTFAAMGLASDQIWWKSIEVAPSMARRVYVTGYQVAPAGGENGPTLHVLRSDDAGAHWSPMSIADMKLATSPLVLVMAVSPTSPDVVYARSEGAQAPKGDILYRSDDGGAHWTEVLATTDAIRAVVVRQSGEVVVATVLGGVFTSQGGQPFTPAATSPEMACLDERADRTLLACGANWSPDNFALGRSTDAASWSKVFRFVEIAGPLACPVGTVQRDTCAGPQWRLLRTQLGIPEAPAADEPTPADRGCGCDASGAGAAAIAGLAVVGAIAVRLRRKRRCCQ